ncbi:hypothetical protein DPEC_G00123220 [Dallia pectoralis]|uniref:Uncharacterized protein n=1 Tax=Dallia pectoralis TaxID=75939 RepID=A0ACC2GQT0_DALPE|nr:hypothetical protein DPEC_G00123220 [Dallia pectoralis]
MPASREGVRNRELRCQVPRWPKLERGPDFLEPYCYVEKQACPPCPCATQTDGGEQSGEARRRWMFPGGNKPACASADTPGTVLARRGSVGRRWCVCFVVLPAPTPRHNVVVFPASCARRRVRAPLLGPFVHWFFGARMHSSRLVNNYV